MVIVFGALWMANRMQMHRQEMTYTEFVKQVRAENVTEVYIDQNKAVPTGTVVFALKIQMRTVRSMCRMWKK